MDDDVPLNWMWSEACEMLTRAERLRQQLFELHRSPTRLPSWEPPIDILETAQQIVILAALPGVDAEQVETLIEGSTLILSGTRQWPGEFGNAIIHRLELPQGRFHRRIGLPSGHYSTVQLTGTDGYLVITLKKVGRDRG